MDRRNSNGTRFKVKPLMMDLKNSMDRLVGLVVDIWSRHKWAQNPKHYVNVYAYGLSLH